jgi:hypothetical protein
MASVGRICVYRGVPCKDDHSAKCYITSAFLTRRNSKLCTVPAILETLGIFEFEVAVKIYSTLLSYIHLNMLADSKGISRSIIAYSGKE